LCVTVKFVGEVALFEEPSLTTTDLEPLVTVGMVNVTATLPLPSAAPPEAIAAVVEPTLTVRPELAVKPAPLTVTEVPTGPLVGFGAPAEAATVKFVLET